MPLAPDWIFVRVRQGQGGRPMRLFLSRLVPLVLDVEAVVSVRRLGPFVEVIGL